MQHVLTDCVSLAGKVVRGSLLTFLNPFSEVWKHGKRAKETVEKSNLKGDGLTMGGLFVIKAGDAGIGYMHVEEVFGRHAPHADVRPLFSLCDISSAQTEPGHLHSRASIPGVFSIHTGC